MSINVIPISQRSIPTNQAITANGSYTLPQYAFIPNAGVQPLSSGFVNNPGPALQSANFVLHPNLASRPYPVPSTPAVYGIRVVQLKQSPG